MNASLGFPQPGAEHAAMPLAGGIAGMGFQCGQLWGAALAAGAQAYRYYGAAPQAEAAAVAAAERLVASFRSSYKSVNCSDVIQIDWKHPKSGQLLVFFLKGGPVRCFSMTAGYARTAFKEIRTTFATAPCVPEWADIAAPVSCAAAVARKMGATDEQAIMTAGFAGGIGLSGGACGALAAAIWILAMNGPGGGTMNFNRPDIADTIDRFVESTEIKFECSEIVGRHFADPKDHAAYVRAGGCAKVLDALVGKS